MTTYKLKELLENCDLISCGRLDRSNFEDLGYFFREDVLKKYPSIKMWLFGNDGIFINGYAVSYFESICKLAYSLKHGYLFACGFYPNWQSKTALDFYGFSFGSLVRLNGIISELTGYKLDKKNAFVVVPNPYYQSSIDDVIKSLVTALQDLGFNFKNDHYFVRNLTPNY